MLSCNGCRYSSVFYDKCIKCRRSAPVDLSLKDYYELKNSQLENKNYEELYNQEPKKILEHVIDDMLVSKGTLDKVTEWRYILMQIEKKL